VASASAITFRLVSGSSRQSAQAYACHEEMAVSPGFLEEEADLGQDSFGENPPSRGTIYQGIGSLALPSLSLK
jgi:hypothetical protein